MEKNRNKKRGKENVFYFKKKSVCVRVCDCVTDGVCD